MSPKYMLDTNICIYLMKHQPDEVRERFAACFVGDVVISAVTLAELEFGIACSSPAVQEANRSALESLLDDILVGPDPNLSHRADRILSQGWKPTLRGSAVDKCRC